MYLNPASKLRIKLGLTSFSEKIRTKIICRKAVSHIFLRKGSKSMQYEKLAQLFGLKMVITKHTDLLKL